MNNLLFLILFFIYSLQDSYAFSNYDHPDSQKELQLLKDPVYSKYLVDLSFKRPNKCPLQSSNNENVLRQLVDITQALKYGECLNRNKDIIVGIEAILDEINKTVWLAENRRKRVDFDWNYGLFERINSEFSLNGLDTTSEQLEKNKTATEKIQRFKGVLNTLKEVSQDEQCILNVKKRGLLPTLADVTLTIGQTAALSQSVNGILISSVGVSLGTTLKILANLIKSPYDWDQPEQRTQFQKINCKFFDLRRDLEKANIMLPPGGNLNDDISEVKSSQKKLSNAIGGLAKRKSNFLKKIENESERYVLQEVGENDHRLLRKSLSVLTALKKNKSRDKNVDLKNEIVKLLMEESFEIVEMIKKSTFTAPYLSTLQSKLFEFQWDQLERFNELDQSDFFDNYYSFILIYLEDFANKLQSKENLYRSNYYNEADESGKKRLDVLLSIKKSYTSIIGKLAGVKNRIDRTVQVLEYRNGKSSFTFKDDGALNSFDLVQQWLYIQDLIYNKVGYSFLSYFRKTLYVELKAFNREYPKFFKQRNEGELNIAWACRNAQQLVLNWQAAKYAAEVSYDFLETNNGIFHSNIKKFRTFMYILPVGRTRQYRFYRTAYSVFIAFSLLNKEMLFTKKDLNRFGRRSSHNLGKLIMKLHESEKNRYELESFMEEHQCKRYL